MIGENLHKCVKLWMPHDAGKMEDEAATGIGSRARRRSAKWAACLDGLSRSLASLLIGENLHKCVKLWMPHDAGKMEDEAATGIGSRARRRSAKWAACLDGLSRSLASSCR